MEGAMWQLLRCFLLVTMTHVMSSHADKARDQRYRLVLIIIIVVSIRDPDGCRHLDEHCQQHCNASTGHE
jgi:hypothetical protein